MSILNKQLAAFLVGIALAAHAAGADGQDATLILPKWRHGDIVEYRMIRTRNDPRGLMPPDVATTPVTLTVVTESDRGFVVEWRQGATTGSIQSESNPVTREMLKLVERAPLMLQVSPVGQVLGLANWEVLRDEAFVTFDRVLAAAQKAGTTPGLVERAGPELRERFASKDVVSGTLVRDARTLLLAMTQPSVASETTVPGLLSNPLGGEPFPSTVKWTARQSPGTTARATVRWTHAVAFDTSSALVREVLTKAITTLGRPVPDLSGVTATASGVGAAEIDLTSGWPEFIEETTTVSVNGRTSIDTTRFERVRHAAVAPARVREPRSQ